MAYDIGPKIGIDGEAEFRKQINNINTNIRTLGTEMKAVTSAFDANDRSQEALTAQSKVLSKQVDAQKQKVDALQQMLDKSAEKYGENDVKTQKWQQAVNNATADLNKMERQLKDLDTEIDKAGKSTDVGGKKFENFGTSIKSVVSGVTATIAAVAVAAAAAVSAIGALTLGAAYAADEINTLSKQTGLSTKEIQKFQFASEQIDVSLDVLTGSMAKMTKNMATASKGTGDAYEAFKALGVEIEGQDGLLRDRNEVFSEAIKALGEMENETQRDAYAMQIFGRSAQDLNPLILGGADALEELGKQAEEAGLILEQDALDKLNAVSDAADTFKATLKATGNAFSVGFAEPLAGGINTVIGYLQQLTTAFSKGGAEEIPNVLKQIIVDAVSKMKETLPQILSFGADLVITIVTGVVETLPELINAAITAFVSLLDTLTAKLPELTPVAIEAVMTVVQGILDNLNTVIEAGIQLLLAVAMGIIQALPDLAEKIPEIVITIINVITDNLPLIIGAAVQIMGALIIGLIQSIPKLIEAVPDIVVALVKAFADMGKKFLEIGKNMVKGIWEGIKSMAKWLKEKVVGMFTGFIDDIKVIFGIHSPSRVFEKEIGAMLAQGIGVGFVNEMDGVSAMMQNSIPTPEVSLADVAAGMVNGVQTAMTGAGGSYRVEIPLYIDGKEFYRATLDDLRSVMRANPVPV